MRYRVLAAAATLALGATGVYAAAQPTVPPTTRQDRIQQRMHERLDKRFATLDANHDGVLSKDELDRALDARLAKVRQRVQKRLDVRFAKADKNQDGVISRDEWPGQAARFDRLDTNHDGALSKDEIRAGLGRRIGRRVRRRG